VLSKRNQSVPTDPIESNIGSVSDQTAPLDGSVIAQHDTVSFRSDLVNVIRGFCMGAADTVPGVSGGTIALILGHYQRLVAAISKVDPTLISHLRDRQFSQAWNYLDARFLLSLGIGVAGGIVTLAGLMHWLLDHRLSETYAVFFGLILASIWIVRRYVPDWNAKAVSGCGMGICIALAIGLLSQRSDSTALPYLFLSGSVAICAMILPGISGAFVLLLFGVYHPITGRIKDTVRLEFSFEGILQMGVFAVGCLFGLLTFSKLLRWLLEHFQSETMAILIGLMIGSVARLWPMQRPTAETAALESKERVMEFIPYTEWTSSVFILLALAVVSAVAVLILDRVAGSTDKNL
ncbi:MAG: DUF368 domain-containing protein, partial [Planctomycetota bacterium]